MDGGVRVTSLHRYPVKACAGEPLHAAEVRVDGLRHDRGLAVVGDGVVLTQREHPVLARVRPVLDDATARLTLSYDGREPVDALVDTSGRTREVTLFGETVAVVDQAPELSAWFSDAARPVRPGGRGTGRHATYQPGSRARADGAVRRGHGVAALRVVPGAAQHAARRTR